MKKNCCFVVGLAALLVTVIVAPATCQQKTETALRVNGAAMACDQVDMWARSFMEANPDIKIVVTGTSAGKGFENLIEGTSEIALASRDISAAEQKKADGIGLKLDNKLVGYAGLALMTTSKNTVNELTLDQIDKMYRGEYTNWNQVGGPDAPVRCLTRRVPESGGAVYFQERVLHNKPFGPGTVFAESFISILKVCGIAKDYPIGIAPAMIAKGDVKILAIKEKEDSKAVKPTEESLKTKSYPLNVPIKMYWNSKSEDSRIKPFVDYCVSKGLPSS